MTFVFLDFSLLWLKLLLLFFGFGEKFFLLLDKVNDLLVSHPARPLLVKGDECLGLLCFDLFVKDHPDFNRVV